MRTAIGLAAVAVSCLAFVPPAHAQRGGGSPAGSYTATCRDSRVSGGVLSARCLDAQGRSHNTSLGISACRGDIANVNGSLSCNGGGRSGNVYPQGAGDPRREQRDRGYGQGAGNPDRNYGR